MDDSPTAVAERAVRQMFAAFAARDVDSALAVVHPDAELWAPTAQLAGRTAPYRGHDGIREYFADVDRLWEEFTVEPGDFRVTYGSVVCFGAAQGRVRGADTAQHLPVIWVFRLREGLIVSCRVARTAEGATELAGD